MRTSRYTVFTGALLAALSAAEVTADPTRPSLTLSLGDRARMIQVKDVDVTGLTAPGPTGDWDFTAVVGELGVSFEVECLPVDQGPMDAALHVPGADCIVELSVFDGRGPVFTGIVFRDYQSCDSSGRTWHGSAHTYPAIHPDFTWVVPSHSVVEFPSSLNLGDQWTEAYQEEHEGEHVTEGYMREFRVSSSVDARGTATLPGIGAVDCLRVNQETTKRTFFGSPPELHSTEFARTYTWLARGVGVVATIGVSGRDPQQDSIPAPGFTRARWLNLLVDYTPAPGTERFVRGEVNGDGSYDITDPVASLSYQFIGTFQPDCLAALDFDDNGIIDLSDPIASLSHQFLGGAAPAAPFSSCGADPTTDLPCESFAACP